MHDPPLAGHDRYLIAIASYRRPNSLQKLLSSLRATIAMPGVDVLVVDNDPAGTAGEVARNHPLRPTYVVEPEPGIAAARNRALREFDDRYRAIIFVDDDEWVATEWLTRLTGYQAATGADVVQGPVISVLPDAAPPWIARGGFIQRRIPDTGQVLGGAATNNTLLCRAAWLRAGAPEFDSSFSETGGSDTEFFWRVRQSGAQIRFCADAPVYEDVPADRLSLTWIRRRAIRNGIAETRLRRKHHDLTVTWLIRSLLRGGRGMAVLGFGVVAGRGLQAKPFNDLFQGYGRLVALVNYRILEYARPDVPDGDGGGPP